MLTVSHTYRKQEYCSYKDIIEECQYLKKGCKTKRDFLIRHNISDDDILYMRNTKDGMKVAEVSSQKNILLIKKSVIDKLMVDETPSDIRLCRMEQFHDEDGKAVPIRIIGERDIDKCYFNVDDVSKAFGMKYLGDVIMDKRASYKEGVHYKIFDNIRGKNAAKDRLYLTFDGLSRTSIVSRQRYGGKDSYLYLIRIGKIKDMKNSMTLDVAYKSTSHIYKYGMTNNIERRLANHERTYGIIKNSDVELVYCSTIDSGNIVEAESLLRKYFVRNDLDAVMIGQKELVVLSKSDLKLAKLKYDKIQMKLCGGKKIDSDKLLIDYINHIRDIMDDKDRDDTESSTERINAYVSESSTEYIDTYESSDESSDDQNEYMTKDVSESSTEYIDAYESSEESSDEPNRIVNDGIDCTSSDSEEDFVCNFSKTSAKKDFDTTCIYLSYLKEANNLKNQFENALKDNDILLCKWGVIDRFSKMHTIHQPCYDSNPEMLLLLFLDRDRLKNALKNVEKFLLDHNASYVSRQNNIVTMDKKHLLDIKDWASTMLKKYGQ